MENRASYDEERRLTNAIERAATVASVNESLDRDQLLADQLKKAAVDPKYAKTASQAFNKRLTVLTFKKTADEHKADPFALSDPDKVYALVSGQNEIKVAAENFDMTIEQLEEYEAMDKAASADLNVIVKDRRYEHLCSWDTFKQRLESEMDKLASGFRVLMSDIDNREQAVDKEAEEVASYFKKANYNFDFTTAVNLYGDKLKAAIGDKVDASFEKTASFVIKPNKEIFKKVAKLLEDRDALEDVKWLAGELANGISEFCKSAAALGDEYQIKEADLQQQIADAQNNVNTLTTQLQALKDKYNADNQSGATAARLQGLGDIIVGTGAGLAEGGIGAVNDITGAARTALNNAKALYYAGNNVSISPGDLLDAAFLTKDRYRDRLLAWSDMSADPQLAMYPAEQVFAATQKAMDMDTSMERPDQREVLRAQVAQLLAQNNRVSTADIAALATTLKSLQGGRGSAAGGAARAVNALGDKSEPGLVNQDAIVGQFGDLAGLKDLRSEASKGLEEAYKKLEDIDKIKSDDAKNEIKDKAIEVGNEQKHLQQLKVDKDKQDEDAIKSKAGKIEAMKKYLIRSKGGKVPMLDSKGNVVYYDPKASGVTISDKDVADEAEKLVNAGASIPNSGKKGNN